MSSPTFPSYASILLAGYSDEPDYGVLRTEMDAPIAKQQARWSIPIIPRSVTIFVEKTEHRLAFDKWMAEEISGGSRWFDWVDPVSKIKKQSRFIGGKIRWESQAGPWTAQAQIETIG